jgi:hypothetical protein
VKDPWQLLAKRMTKSVNVKRAFLALLLIACSGSPSKAADATILAIDVSRFTVNSEPTFLLGMSYYGGLGAPKESVLRDLDDMERCRFNWLRVWATWEGFGEDVSAVDSAGRPREPFASKLQWLVAECDRRGLIVDVTLTRGATTDGVAPIGRVADFESHERAVTTLIDLLRDHRNWYLDLANERDVGDARYVSPEELKSLRELVRRLDPQRLVTASFGGHDLGEGDLLDALNTADLDFLCPHRPRVPESPTQTEAHTRQCLALQKRLKRLVPIHYQEPFRRGYETWEPTAADFLDDLRGAIAGGAAGWCFHNGSQRNAEDGEPRRSFDLRARRLFDQLDAEERKVVAEAASLVSSNPAP